ncbi:MAG TPA: dTMP kinase [Candidatus Limnocylindria bacterium]
MTAGGRFITLEGPEGSGKTTASRHLAEWLRARGVPTMLTHEPGGTPLGDEVRRIVLHMRGMSDDLDPRADALLFAAGRAQHVATVIRPALERGEWVVCARYIDSSLAYQGAGYGNDMADLRRLQEFATAGLRPDLTLLLDLPVDVGLERTRRRAEWNRFEDTEELAFFERVRRAYLDFAADEPDRFEIVNGSGSVEEADAAIRGIVQRRLL